MSPEEVLVLRLRREIEHELAGLDRLREEHRGSPPRKGDALQVRGRASVLHDFYTGAERIFMRIAEEIDGGIPRSQQRHRQLLAGMALDLPGVRPPVVSETLCEQLAEFLRFRHLFRTTSTGSHSMRPASASWSGSSIRRSNVSRASWAAFSTG